MLWDARRLCHRPPAMPVQTLSDTHVHPLSALLFPPEHVHPFAQLRLLPLDGLQVQDAPSARLELLVLALEMLLRGA